MKNELAQSVTDAATSQPVALSVSGLTLGTGVSTALQLMPVVVGSMASLLGIVLSIMLIRKAYYSTRREQMEIDELERCNLERGLDSTRREDP